MKEEKKMKTKKVTRDLEVDWLLKYIYSRGQKFLRGYLKFHFEVMNFEIQVPSSANVLTYKINETDYLPEFFKDEWIVRLEFHRTYVNKLFSKLTIKSILFYNSLRKIVFIFLRIQTRNNFSPNILRYVKSREFFKTPFLPY